MLDLVLGAQRRGGHRGETLWEDRLSWFGDAEAFRDPVVPVRLALPPEPSLVRTVTIEASARTERPFTIVFESESRTSLRAAARAGVGITVFCSFDEMRSDTDDAAVLPTIESIEYFLRKRMKAATSRGMLPACCGSRPTRAATARKHTLTLS